MTKRIKENKPLYTIQRITKAGKFLGPIHYAHNDRNTVCGKEIDGDGWWFLTTNFDGAATCKKCLQIMKLELSKKEEE